MKPSRSKPTRSERKLGRERRERALQHGLPAAAAAPSRRVHATDPGSFSETLEESTRAVASSSGPSLERLGFRARLARIPLSIQLLGAGIVVLIAIGLFRRYTEDLPGNWEASSVSPETASKPAVPTEGQTPTPSTSNSVAVIATTPSASARVPTVAAGSAVVAGTKPKPVTPSKQSGLKSQNASRVGDATPVKAENPD